MARVPFTKTNSEIDPDEAFKPWEIVSPNRIRIPDHLTDYMDGDYVFPTRLKQVVREWLVENMESTWRICSYSGLLTPIDIEFDLEKDLFHFIMGWRG